MVVVYKGHLSLSHSTCTAWGATKLCSGPPTLCAVHDLIVTQHGLKIHQYDDDCQICVPSPLGHVDDASDQCSCCVHAVEESMSADRLGPTANKTQGLWHGSRHNVDRQDSLLMICKF